MNFRIGLLSVLAVVQLVVIAGFWFIPRADQDEGAVLLNFDAAGLSGLEISDVDHTITLNKTATGWQVESLPADEDKVDGLLNKLVNLSAPWPVAATSSSVERFEVGEENFQRRLRLLANDETLAQLFLGTSPGYQRVHARKADSEEVFSVALSNFEVGASIDDWLNKGLLATGEPTKIEVQLEDRSPAQILARVDDNWTIDGEPAASGPAQTYANRFKTLSVLGIGDAQAVDKRATIRVTTASAEHHLNIFQETAAEDGAGASGGGDYFIAREIAGDIAGEDEPQLFRLPAYVAEQLLMTDTDFSPDEAVEDGDIGEDAAGDGAPAGSG